MLIFKITYQQLLYSGWRKQGAVRQDNKSNIQSCNENNNSCNKCIGRCIQI